MKKILLLIIAAICIGVSVEDMSAKSTETINSGKGGVFSKITKKRVFKEDNPGFESSEPIGIYNQPKISIDCEVDIDWPERLDGCDDLAPLYKYLIVDVLQGNPDDNVETVVENYMTSMIEYHSGCPADGESSLKISHEFFSDNISVFRIYEYHYLLDFLETTSCFIFDKKNGKILSGKDIINTNAPGLLKVVNKAIKTEGYQDVKVDKLPDVFVPTETSLIFVFGRYEFSPMSRGITEITIPYSKLMPFLTQRFRALMGLRFF